ncbi:hypothetical protein ACFVX6_31430 [Streptomyces sp. NPDC058289]|uniref:hypothetical protein n=1 Tax=Streptomyces sp. NPDC058289 TaxID=3346425 RepID=UPI0036F114DB
MTGQLLVDVRAPDRFRSSVGTTLTCADVPAEGVASGSTLIGDSPAGSPGGAAAAPELTPPRPP